MCVQVALGRLRTVVDNFTDRANSGGETPSFTGGKGCFLDLKACLVSHAETHTNRVEVPTVSPIYLLGSSDAVEDHEPT